MEDLFVRFPDLVIKDDTSGAEELKQICKNIKSQINKLHTSQISICFYMNQIRDFFKKYGKPMYAGDLNINFHAELTKTQGTFSFYSEVQLVGILFRISKTSYYRYLKIYDTFFIDGVLDKHFTDFDISKLGELSVFPLTELIKDVPNRLNPNMTKKEIIEYVKRKSSTGGTPEEDKEKAKKKENQSSIVDSEPITGLYVTFEDVCNERIKKVVQSGRFATPSEYINHLVKIDIKASNLSST